MIRPSDKEKYLIDGALKNDRKAQHELFMSYKDAMYSILYRFLGNVQDAEDALQEGFVKVFTKIESFSGNSTLGAWMKTIFIRTALEKIRKRVYYSDIEEATNESMVFDDELTGELLEKAILTLDEGYRSIFLMVEVEGYKHREVAEIMGISEGTSKSQLSRAKKKLQKLIGDLSDIERL